MTATDNPPCPDCGHPLVEHNVSVGCTAVKRFPDRPDGVLYICACWLTPAELAAQKERRASVTEPKPFPVIGVGMPAYLKLEAALGRCYRSMLLMEKYLPEHWLNTEGLFPIADVFDETKALLGEKS